MSSEGVDDHRPFRGSRAERLHRCLLTSSQRW